MNGVRVSHYHPHYYYCSQFGGCRPLSMIGESTFTNTNLTIDVFVENANGSAYIGVNFHGLTSGMFACC